MASVQGKAAVDLWPHQGLLQLNYFLYLYRRYMCFFFRQMTVKGRRVYQKSHFSGSPMK